MTAQPAALSLAGLIATSVLCVSTLHAAAQERGSTTDLGDPECAACEIIAVPIVSLGDPDGPGMLESEFNNVRVDRRGRYFVTGTSSPYFWVFDGSGRVLDRVGRGGEGPGEFAEVVGMVIGEADSVLAVDNFQGRVSVYTPDLEFTRTFRLGFFPDGPALFIDGSFLVNSGIRTQDLLGEPFHVFDRDGLRSRSFGSAGDLNIMPEIRDLRVLARADSTSFWAARINQYLIERWTMDGRLLETLHREPQWFEVWWEPQIDADTPPVPIFHAMAPAGDTLWVLGTAPGERWRLAVEPEGRFFTVTDEEAYQNAVLEAVDPRRGTVIASQRMPMLFHDLLEGGLAVRNETDEVGNPIVRIYRLEIRNPAMGHEQESCNDEN